MFYPEELVEEVRTRNDIVGVVSQYVKMTKRGGNYFGCCPFHNEKTPSFSVSPSKQMYYCFGCGAGGNVISFVMAYENYTFLEALKMLAERAGITLPEGEMTEEQKQKASLKAKLLEANKEAAKYYYYLLKTPGGKKGLEYLTNRGLSEETIRKFGLGYSPMSRDQLYRYLKKKGFSDEILSQSGLVKISEKGVTDRFWNRVMYPIMDVNSKVIGFGGRVMGQGEPKYLNSPETVLFDKSRNLYGLHLARHSKRPYFLICEGYMDVIAMHQAGFDCAVASLGTAFTTGHAMLIKRYVKEVILTYDSDGAGVKAAMRAIPMLKSVGMSIRVLNMRPYKDPDEFIVHEGAEAFQKRIDEAVNSFLYECDILRTQYDLNNPEKKTEFHRAVAAKLTEFPDELERNNYLEAVCSRHAIPQEALRDMVRRIAAARPEESSGYRSSGDRYSDGDGYSGGNSYGRSGSYGQDSNSYGRSGSAAQSGSSYGNADPYGREDEPQNGPMRRQRKQKDKNEGVLEAQRLVLNWALSGDGRLNQLAEYLSPADFTDPVCRKLAEEVAADLQRGVISQPAALMNRFEEEEERNQVAAVFNTVLDEENEKEENNRILAENVRRIRRTSLDRAARETTDPAELMKIIQDKKKLESQKIRLK